MRRMESHSDRPRLDALTALRFFAAAAVVIHHSRGLFLPQALGGWLLAKFGVSFFFVLSGFILVHVYPELPTGRSVVRFWMARVARLWPLHLVSIGLLFVLVDNRLYVGI